MDANGARLGVPSFEFDRETTERTPFPRNVRDSTSGAELARMVSEVVKGFESASPRRKVLLGAIAYSYASGVYDSEEIERSLYETQNSATLAPEAWADGIRYYRRNHRPEIERCLADVLRRTWDAGEARDFTREAAERVNRAIRQDSWSLDF
jgi:hypothetical protein